MSLCFNEAANQKPIVPNDCQRGWGGVGGAKFCFPLLSFPLVMSLVHAGLRKSLSSELQVGGVLWLNEVGSASAWGSRDEALGCSAE